MLNLSLTAFNFDLTDKIRLLIDEKLALKLDQYLQTFDPEVKTALVRLEKQKHDIYEVSFDMLLPGKERIYAKTSHRLLRSALIDLQQQIEKQIKKYKQELSDTTLSS